MDWIIDNQRTIMIVFSVAGSFVIFDVVTGLLQAVYNKTMKSEVMRRGLMHKCGVMLALVFGLMLNCGGAYIDLGVEIPALQCIAAYVVLMEAKSIVENLCAISPDLRGLLGRIIDNDDETKG